MGLRKRQIMEVEIDGIDIDPVLTAHQLKEMLHKNAAEAFNEETINNLIAWISERFKNLRIERDDTIRLTLRPWNLEGYGYQSVVIAALNKGTSVRLENETIDPEVVVIASSLIDSSVLPAIHNFEIKDGETQIVRTFKPTYLDLTNGDDNLRGTPQVHPANIHLEVSRPFTLRTIIERGMERGMDTGLNPKAVRRKNSDSNGVFVITTESTA